MAPGPVWTPLIPSTMPENQVEPVLAPRPRWDAPAQPAELAPAYVFLASEAASYIVGAHPAGDQGGVPSCEVLPIGAA